MNEINYDSNVLEPMKQKLYSAHQHRLTKEERDESGILLSICIPSYNRGLKAKKSIDHLRQMKYGNEIEFVVSDNGSSKETEGYTYIEKLDDSRISYHRFDENKMFLGNFWKVISMAKGKYVLLMSDEDEVIIENIPYFLQLVKDYPKLGIIRTKCDQTTGGWYDFSKDRYLHAGDEAFKGVFLANNYMSGIIYKKEILTDAFIDDFISANQDNEAYKYYPHFCLDMTLSLKYDYLECSKELFRYGAPSEVECYLDKEGDEKNLLDYQTLSARIKQHLGYTELLNQFEFGNILTKIEVYQYSCLNLFFLVNIIKQKAYVSEWTNVCSQMKEACYSGLDILELGKYNVEDVLDCIKERIDIYFQDYLENELV